MVAVVTGSGTGLERTSAWILGGFGSQGSIGRLAGLGGLAGVLGQMGDAAVGRHGDNAYVNAANGNLIINRQDEILSGRGQSDVYLGRTYNSLGQLDGDNNDGWRMSLTRQLSAIPSAAALNTAGSSVTLVDWDGAEEVFTWDAAYKWDHGVGTANQGTGAYVFKGGAGAHDTLVKVGSNWIRTDGTTQIHEAYEGSGGGRLLSTTDPEGNTTNYAYTTTGSLRTVRATMSNGDWTEMAYVVSTNRLTEVRSHFNGLQTASDIGAADHDETLTRYEYDSAGRLSTVKVDLTYTTSGVADTETFLTEYDYDGTSDRIRTISQNGLTQVLVEYDSSGRVVSFSQYANSSEQRTTLFAYDDATRKTTVTDPAGRSTFLTYDAAGQLTRIDPPPATTTASTQSILFGYDAQGNVTSINMGGGNVYGFEYDARGNLTLERDGAGNTIQRVYDDYTNLLLEEIQYRIADPSPDEAGVGQAADPVSTHYIYDDYNRLNYIVDPEGRVTWYNYGVANQRHENIILDLVYPAANIANGVSLAELDGWRSHPSRASARVQKTRVGYDSRGNIRYTQTYSAATLADQYGSSGALLTTVYYTYNQRGWLLKKIYGNSSGPTELFIYDGRGRLLSSTDYNQASTTYVYSANNGVATTTLADGRTITSTFNRIGELAVVDQAPAGGTSVRVVRNYYDKLGNLRRVLDAAGQATYYLYDQNNRLSAEIRPDGAMTEYRRDVVGRVVATIRYANPVSSANLASLTDVNGPVDKRADAVRPATNPIDLWTWSTYNNANLVARTVASDGAVAIFGYDGAGRLTAIRRQFNRVADLSSYKTYSTSTAAPPAPATHSEDRVTRFYTDAAGRRSGVLDGESHYTAYEYDAAGNLSHSIAYASQVSTTQITAGTVPTDAANDVHVWNLYDARGFLKATIQSSAYGPSINQGLVTRYDYHPLGYVTRIQRGEVIAIDGFITTAPTLASLSGATASGDFDITSLTYDLYGRPMTEVRTLASGTETITNAYNVMGKLLTQTTVQSQTGDQRASRYVYDHRGRLQAELHGEGAQALAAISAPSAAQLQEYGITFTYDDLDRLIKKTTPQGSTSAGLATYYFYDSDGALTYEVDALGQVTTYAYDGLGRLLQTTRVAKKLESFALVGGAQTAALASAVTALASNADAISQQQYDAGSRVNGRTDAEGYETSYEYNAFGEVQQTDQRAYNIPELQTYTRTALTYDRMGRLTSSIQDSTAGRLQYETTYAYDAFGRLSSVTDPADATRTSEYDRAGRIVKETDALLQSTTYDYDGRSNLIKQTDRTGGVTTWSYTAFNRKKTVTLELGTSGGLTTVIEANAFGQTIQITAGAASDSSLQTTTYTYTRDGLLDTVQTAAGTIDNNYNKAGQLIETRDGRNIRTAYAYDAVGRVLTQTTDTGGLNLSTTYEYDIYDSASQTLRTLVTDPSGRQTLMVHDRLGRQTSVIQDPGEGGSPGLGVTTTYTYNRLGQVRTETRGAGTADAITTTYVYDTVDRLKESWSGTYGATNGKSLYAYDANGNLISRTDGFASGSTGVVTRYAYDAENRLVFEVDPTGAISRNIYDAEGRVTEQRRYVQLLTSTQRASFLTDGAAYAPTTDGSDRRSFFYYDAAGQLRFTSEVMSIGGIQKYSLVEQVHDKAGAVSQTIRYSLPIPSGASLTYAGLVALTDQVTDSMVSDPDKRVTRSYYDGAGREIYRIDAEGYVTGFVLDPNGQVTSERRNRTKVSATAASSLSNLTSALDTAGAGDVVKTDYIYDKAGRLIETLTDDQPSVAGQISTTYSYDGAGRLTRIYAGRLKTGEVYNTADAAVITDRTYDKAGRLSVEERWVTSTAGDRARTEWTYLASGLTDTVSVLQTNADTDGHAVRAVMDYAYDSAGRQVGADLKKRLDTAAATLISSTSQSYDALGNVTVTVDANGVATYFSHDAAGRVTRQVDGTGAVTNTDYTSFGEIESITRYFNRLSASQLTTVASSGTIVLPTLDSARDATTSFEYDRAGRLVGTTDAEGYSETYTLDAYDGRLSVTNRLDGVTLNTFDRRGLLISETLPEGGVINTYAYDNLFGLMTKKTEAAGLPEQRVTDFDYDDLGRLIAKRGEAVTPTGTNLVDQASAQPTETYTYDRRGNLIDVAVKISATETTRTHFYFDDLDRKIGQADANGVLTTWTYDKAGNVVATRVYETPIAAPSVSARTFVAPTDGKYRETLYTYDISNRLIETRIESVLTGRFNGSVYQSSSSDIVTGMTYDANGNLTSQTDGEGNTTLFFYDKANRQIAKMDGERYVTQWTRDSDGNVLKEVRYAAPVASTYSVTTGTAVASLINQVDGSNNVPDAPPDRVTDFEYDRNGQRTKESRLGVMYRRLDATTGALLSTAYTGSSSISYEYNGLGLVTRKIMGVDGLAAHNEETLFIYDTEGRLEETRGAVFVDVNGDTVRNRIRHDYDGLNNVVETREDGVKLSGSTWVDAASDRVTHYAYGAGGRLDTLEDASGFQRHYGYDLAGRVVKESWTRTKADGVTEVTEAQAYRYDKLGRLSWSANATQTGSTWSFEPGTELRYDSFGAVIGKGTRAATDIGTGALQETFQYDKAGRLTRSTAGDGVIRFYVNDSNGDATLAIASEGADLTLASQDTAGELLTLLKGTGTKQDGLIKRADITTTITVYDARGQATEAREQWRELSAGDLGSRFTTNREYNAFGEVESETDARLNRTTFGYNTLGRLVSKTGPAVAVYGETNTVASTDQYHYDLSGRLIATTDANLNVNTRTLLAGAGHDDDNAIVLGERHADGGRSTVKVDVFGDARQIKNELNFVETRAYDALSRLVRIDRTGASDLADDATPGGLKEYFRYDGLGRRTATWNSAQGTSTGTGSTVEARTEYDDMGRVVQTVDVAGFETDYDYTWNAGLQTKGAGSTVIGAYGGWTKTTTTVSTGRTAIQDADYFGRIVSREDLGGHDYDVRFDRAGRVVSETNSLGLDMAYGWFNTGRAASVVDGRLSTPDFISTYSYDANGNRTLERHASGSSVYQDATVAYDALNRMTAYSDTAAATAVDFTWAYDRVGNVLRREGLDATIYSYDAMNRVQYDGGGASKTYSYDAAGNRIAATWNEQRQYTYTGVNSGYSGTLLWYQATIEEQYVYDGAGRLDKTMRREKVNQDSTIPPPADPQWGGWYTTRDNTYDALGRLTQQGQHSYSYDVLSRLVDETSDEGGRITTTHYDYRLKSGSAWTGADLGGSVTHVRSTSTGGGSPQVISELETTYAWFDGAVRQAETNRPNTSQQTVWQTQHTLDARGRVAQAQISDGLPRTVDFVYNDEGEVLNRLQSTASGSWTARFHYVAGKVVEASSLATEGGAGPSSADDQIVVREGDTLQTLAASNWGDATLWYLIAERNGLSGSETLEAGQVIWLPANVNRSRNAADTFTPYDPNTAMGDLSPTQFSPTHQSTPGCGIVGQIMTAVVAIAVTVIAGPVIGPVLGNLAGQAFGLATGNQDQFSWKSLGLSVVSAGVSSALKPVVETGLKLTGTAAAIVSATASNVVTQGIGVATGLQDRFDWTGVAASALMAGVGSEVGQAAKPYMSTDAAQFASSTASAFAGAATRTLLDGTSFGDNIIAVLPDVIGQTIGNRVAGGIGARVQAGSTPSLAGSSDGFYLNDETGQIDPNRYFMAPEGRTYVAGGQPTAQRGFWGRQYDRFLKPIVDPLVNAGRTIARSFTRSIDYTRESVGAAYVGLPDDVTQLEEVVVTGVRDTQRRVNNFVDTSWTTYRSAVREDRVAATAYVTDRARTAPMAQYAMGQMRAPSSGPVGSPLSASMGPSPQYRAPIEFQLDRVERADAMWAEAKESYASSVDPYNDPLGQVFSLGKGMGLHTMSSAERLLAPLSGTLDYIGQAPQAASGNRIPATYVGDLAMFTGSLFVGQPEYGLMRSGPRGAASVLDDVVAIHGNSKLSPRTAYLYELYSMDGTFLKNGVTQNLDTRYSKTFMADKRIFRIDEGSRADMLFLERQRTIANPGPLNREPWAVRARAESLIGSGQ